MKMRSILATAALLCLVVALPESNASAQQREQVSFTIPNENSKYTVSQSVDVGDTPTHVVRVFEVHNTVPNNAASINGLKLIEVFVRGTSDLTNGQGGGPGYMVFVVENGDKLFSRNAWVAQRDGSGKLTATWGGAITGGTGKLANTQGTTRLVTNFDPSPGGLVSNSQFDVEYSIGK
jgi:hypothetical protein